MQTVSEALRPAFGDALPQWLDKAANRDTVLRFRREPDFPIDKVLESTREHLASFGRASDWRSALQCLDALQYASRAGQRPVALDATLCEPVAQAMAAAARECEAGARIELARQALELVHRLPDAAAPQGPTPELCACIGTVMARAAEQAPPDIARALGNQGILLYQRMFRQRRVTPGLQVSIISLLAEVARRDPAAALGAGQRALQIAKEAGGEHDHKVVRTALLAVAHSLQNADSFEASVEAASRALADDAWELVQRAIKEKWGDDSVYAAAVVLGGAAAEADPEAASHYVYELTMMALQWPRIDPPHVGQLLTMLGTIIDKNEISDRGSRLVRKLNAKVKDAEAAQAQSATLHDVLEAAFKKAVLRLRIGSLRESRLACLPKDMQSEQPGNRPRWFAGAPQEAAAILFDGKPDVSAASLQDRTLSSLEGLQDEGDWRAAIQWVGMLQHDLRRDKAQAEAIAQIAQIAQIAPSAAVYEAATKVFIAAAKREAEQKNGHKQIRIAQMALGLAYQARSHDRGTPDVLANVIDTLTVVAEGAQSNSPFDLIEEGLLLCGFPDELSHSPALHRSMLRLLDVGVAKYAAIEHQFRETAMTLIRDARKRRMADSGFCTEVLRRLGASLEAGPADQLQERLQDARQVVRTAEVQRQGTDGLYAEMVGVLQAARQIDPPGTPAYFDAVLALAKKSRFGAGTMAQTLEFLQVSASARQETTVPQGAASTDPRMRMYESAARACLEFARQNKTNVHVDVKQLMGQIWALYQASKGLGRGREIYDLTIAMCDVAGSEDKAAALFETGEDEGVFNPGLGRREEPDPDRCRLFQSLGISYSSEVNLHGYALYRNGTDAPGKPAIRMLLKYLLTKGKIDAQTVFVPGGGKHTVNMKIVKAFIEGQGWGTPEHPPGTVAPGRLPGAPNMGCVMAGPLMAGPLREHADKAAQGGR